MSATAGPAAPGSSAQHVPLAALEAKLDEVLEACGLDRDASMTPFQKLTTLEVRLPSQMHDAHVHACSC